MRKQGRKQRKKKQLEIPSERDTIRANSKYVSLTSASKNFKQAGASWPE